MIPLNDIGTISLTVRMLSAARLSGAAFSCMLDAIGIPAHLIMSPHTYELKD